MDKLGLEVEERMANRLTIIDYYDASNGPTLRIDVMRQNDLIVFRDTIISLANRAVLEATFSKRGPIEAHWMNVQSIRLKLAVKMPKKTVRMQASPPSVNFEWVLDDEGWLECAELVDGLFEGGGDGHQYLSRAADDDALIVLAFGERDQTAFARWQP
jgi:hypothetical protein